jgi:hypothetical protein
MFARSAARVASTDSDTCRCSKVQRTPSPLLDTTGARHAAPNSVPLPSATVNSSAVMRIPATPVTKLQSSFGGPLCAARGVSTRGDGSQCAKRGSVTSNSLPRASVNTIGGIAASRSATAVTDAPRGEMQTVIKVIVAPTQPSAIGRHCSGTHDTGGDNEPLEMSSGDSCCVHDCRKSGREARVAAHLDGPTGRTVDGSRDGATLPTSAAVSEALSGETAGSHHPAVVPGTAQ